MIVATGSRVKSLPGLEPDGERIVTSDDVLASDKLPKDVIVVGGGAVGVEFASMYHDLGVKVTLLEYLPAIVPLEDREVSKALERSFTRRGMTVITSARFDADEGRASTRRRLRHGRAGRQGAPGGPGGDDCSSPPAGPPTSRTSGSRRRRPRWTGGSSRSTAGCGPASRTSYAIGDIVGGLMLAHTAAHEGIVRGPHDRRRQGRPPDRLRQAAAGDLLPPEIASIGLTEQQCEEQGLPIKVGKVPFQAIAKAIIGGEYEGFAKIIANKETDETLGIHLIGPHATDLIAEASLAFDARGDAMGDRGRDARPPDALGDHRRGGDGRRRPIDQLLSRQRRTLMAVTPDAARQRRAHLGDAVGLSDDDLLEMYRRCRARPRRRRADVDPQPRRAGSRS